MSANRSLFGFSLAELLIALAILGVIATFTIPKVLQSNQDSRLNAIAKETAAMLSNALEEHRRHGQLTASTRSSDLTPYINYVKIETSDDDNCGMDAVGSSTSTYGCGFLTSNHFVVLRLHHGGLVRFPSNDPFNGTAATNAIRFFLDPDGKPTGTGGAVGFFLYYNGRLTTQAHCHPSYAGCPYVNSDPSWLKW